MKQVIYDIYSIDEAEHSRFGYANTMLFNALNNCVLSDQSHPKGFLISDNAYEEILNYNFLERPIQNLFSLIKREKPQSLSWISTQLQQLLLNASLPFAFQVRVTAAYKKLSELSAAEGLAHMVCSPMYWRDSEPIKPPNFSVFNFIKGEEEILNGCKKCYASLFDQTNLQFQLDHDISLPQTKFSIGIIEADLGKEGPVKDMLSLLENQYDDMIVV